jgi:hypothetical protein
MSNKSDDKTYEDGFRDAKHDGARNPPHVEWFPFMRDSFWEENAEYHKGYNAGKTSKK